MQERLVTWPEWASRRSERGVCWHENTKKQRMSKNIFYSNRKKTYVFVKVKRRARYRSAREIRRTAKGYGRERKGLCTKKMRPSLALRRGAARQRGSAQRAETQASGRPRTAREKERREMSWSNEIAIFRSGGCFARDDLPGTPRYSCEQDAAELFSAFKQDARPSFCESANANL